MIAINLAYEDDLSEFVMTRLLGNFQGRFHVAECYSRGGSGYLKKRIRGFSQASAFTPFFVLTDLDRNECAPTMMAEWLDFAPHDNLIFRIAVREVESWILADKEGFADFLGISAARIPENPDGLADPKRTLMNLAAGSRKRKIREDIVPVSDNARIGPNYNGRLMEFVLGNWDIERASNRSDSLRRAIRHLERFRPTS
jgi:hypothetical protein